jgi:hypothetical protein
MSASIAIATAHTEWFTAVRAYLLAAGIDLATLGDEPLTSGIAVDNWLGNGTPRLLVLDAGIPVDPSRKRDDSSTLAARDILDKLRGESVAALVVTSSPDASSALQPICGELDNALILPNERLRKLREKILRPFLAMLSQGAAATSFGASFQIIEAELRSDGVKVRLGVGGTRRCWTGARSQISLI